MKKRTIIKIFIVVFIIVLVFMQTYCDDECKEKSELILLREISSSSHSDSNIIINEYDNNLKKWKWEVILAELYPHNFVLVTFEGDNIVGQYYAKHTRDRDDSYA